MIAAWESKYSWERWGDFLGHADPAGLARYIRTGGLVLESPVFAMDRVTGLFAEVGIPFERLSPAQLRERFPALDTGRYYPPRALADDRFWDDASGEIGALWTEDGGYVHDPQLATHNLMHAAQADGAQLVLGATIGAIGTSEGRVTGVRTTAGQEISAPIVVNAHQPGRTPPRQRPGRGERGVRDLDPAAAAGGALHRPARRSAADRADPRRRLRPRHLFPARAGRRAAGRRPGARLRPDAVAGGSGRLPPGRHCRHLRRAGDTAGPAGARAAGPAAGRDRGRL